MFILGVDPGLQSTGWGVISNFGNQLKFVDCGTVKTNTKDSMPIRLKDISRGLTEVLGEHQIHESAVEEVFVNKNNLSSLKLGHARGAIILTLALEGLEASEYAATNIKKSIVGVGRADKNQMISMVKMLLPRSNIKNDHEADALAVAITHAHNIQMMNSYNAKNNIHNLAT